MASPQRRQLKRPSQPLRTVSKALRTLGTSEEIQCTKSLIRAYNDNDAASTKGIALHRWLETYIDEFSKWKAECVHDSWIREYALLAMIDVKTSAAAELLRRVYVSLRACVRADGYCSPVIVVALDNMLRVMDIRVVEKETQSLVSLADDLLSLTDPKKCIFTRDTYPVHMACLLTLERILIVLYGVECAHSRQWIFDFFQKRLRTQLKAIEAKQKYYPFVYNMQIIKHNIDGLVKDSPTALLLNVGRRAFYALCGGLYLFQGIRELAVMRLDFATMEAGVQKMHQAFSGMLETRAPGLQEVFHAALKSETTQDFSHVMECYEKHEHRSFINGVAPQELKIIKFALVSHLTLFAIDTSANSLSDQAFRLLSNLATNDDTAQWRADPEIYECLLDALASVGEKKQSLRQDCLLLLRQMENTSIQNQQTVKEWRGGSSIEQKLHMKCNNESEIPNPSLYDAVRKHLELHLTHTHNLEDKKKLIMHYQEDSFAKVSLLLDDFKKRHIASFDFHIVVYESFDAMDLASNNASLADGDQIAHNLERSRWVQKPIKLRNIFAKRRQKPSGPEEEVNRVLLLGNPGTGKTSLSKRLCHEWSTCNWGSKFERVYLLPIRQLTQSRLQSEKTLEGAIAVLMFNADRKSQDERIALHRQIKDELDERTTLLVLDGLDEANGNDSAEEIVKDATSRPCSFLALSRPHNLGDLRSKVDVQVECLGLTADQLKAYIRREVPDTSDELLHFLNGSPQVREIAQVPVSSQILCTLWNSEETKRLKESKSLSLKSLYTLMIEYAWQRFVEKTGENADRQAVFRSLEIIAFKSIRQGKIEIPYDLVMKHAQGATTLKLLRDSGFLLFYMEGQVFQFAHLSFHEFFAGQFLAKNLRDTAKQRKKAEQYIAKRKYCDTSRVILSFMTQCYCQEEDDDEDNDCIENLKQILSTLDENPLEVVGFQHTMLKMRTLDAFLSVCGNCSESIRSDNELKRFVEYVRATLSQWVEGPWHFGRATGMHANHSDFFDQIMEDLRRMPSLLTYFPELVRTLLKCCKRKVAGYDPSKIARLVSYAPNELLRMKPTLLQANGGDDSEFSDKGDVFDVDSWLYLFADSGPECAVLVLDQLKTTCQDHRVKIRKDAYQATVKFLKVFPEREDLRSLCLDAMKDVSAEVRFHFIDVLGQTSFKPNSVAANLAWTLTLEATRDEDEKVRRKAVAYALRSDQTSEESIEKMIELVVEYTSVYVNGHADGRTSILRSIPRFLKRFPTRLTVFLPLLATCCNDPNEGIRSVVTGTIRKLSSVLPTSQTRELGEMMSSTFCDVQDPEVRRGLVAVLNDIGQKMTNFKTDFPDVFSQACRDSNNQVNEFAKTREGLIASAGSVQAINTVFWDQSFEVKKKLLSRIQRDRMVNTETAEILLEMALNCLESDTLDLHFPSALILLSLTKFFSLSNEALRRLLNIIGERNGGLVLRTVYKQPLAVLLEYFWETKDERVVRPIAEKHMLVCATHQTTQDGKTVVSIMDKGKSTQQEVPTELAEKLSSLVKLKLREIFGNFLP